MSVNEELNDSVQIYEEILDKLNSYRDIASTHNVDINVTHLHMTHGVFFSTNKFKEIQEHNFLNMFGLEYDFENGNSEEFLNMIYDNILNFDEIKDNYLKSYHQFLNNEIDRFRLENILYKRNDELLYLDVKFTSLDDDYIVAIVDDVTDYIQDKLLLEQYAVQNNILVKEVHHRVKNNLQILLSLISLQERFNSTGNQISEYMKLSISAMALIHNQLYSDNLDYLSLKNLLSEFNTNIENLYVKTGINFNLEAKKDVKLTIDKSNPIFLVINELIINSIKHAFEESDEDKRISCIFDADDENIYIEYSDNGKGLELLDNDATSLGHVLVDSLVRQIDGSYELKSDNGYVMNITVPL